jgi:hypothetical protein
MPKANGRSAIEQWKSITQNTSQSFTPWTSEEDPGDLLLNWVKEMVGHMGLGRKINLSQDRVKYLYMDLQQADYQLGQAERAQMWIKYGDWSFKGVDPTLELSDFFPTDDQYQKTKAKRDAKIEPPNESAKYQHRPDDKLMTTADRERWAVWLHATGHQMAGWDVPWIKAGKAIADQLMKDPDYRPAYPYVPETRRTD